MGYQGIKPPCLQCGKPSYSRKLCKNCYYRARYAGQLNQFPEISADEVFMSRINKTDSCWIWMAGKTQAGYGIMTLNRKNVFAHRHSYSIFRGPIPEGCVLLHECDNPSCVNPWHLRAGSQKENSHDARDKKRLKYGEQHHAAKLTTEQVEAIRFDARPQSVIAAEYGVWQQHISRIKRGARRRVA